jgi:hypothetical protein
MTTFDKLIGGNRCISLALNPEFTKLFRCSLKPFWDNITGFDIVAFDKQIVKSGDNAMYDVVKEKYGEAGTVLIERLIQKLPLTPAQINVAVDWLGESFVSRFTPMLLGIGEEPRGIFQLLPGILAYPYTPPLSADQEYDYVAR